VQQLAKGIQILPLQLGLDAQIQIAPDLVIGQGALSRTRSSIGCERKHHQTALQGPSRPL
jgi:hypothetical protein